MDNHERIEFLARVCNHIASQPEPDGPIPYELWKKLSAGPEVAEFTIKGVIRATKEHVIADLLADFPDIAAATKKMAAVRAAVSVKCAGTEDFLLFLMAEATNFNYELAALKNEASLEAIETASEKIRNMIQVLAHDQEQSM